MGQDLLQLPQEVRNTLGRNSEKVRSGYFPSLSRISASYLIAPHHNRPWHPRAHRKELVCNPRDFSLIIVTGDPAKTGSVQGVVKDAEGNTVERAEVTLTSVGSEVRAAMQLPGMTDSEGVYLFEGAPLGEYTISIHINGMETSDPISVRVQAAKPAQCPPLSSNPLSHCFICHG